MRTEKEGEIQKHFLDSDIFQTITNDLTNFLPSIENAKSLADKANPI